MNRSDRGQPDADSRSILFGEHVAGNIRAWTDAVTRERLIGYWIGREFWGRGIASAAVSQLLRSESIRPLNARIAKHNLGSIRVLEQSSLAPEKMLSLCRTALPVEEFTYVLSTCLRRPALHGGG